MDHQESPRLLLLKESEALMAWASPFLCPTHTHSPTCPCLSWFQPGPRYCRRLVGVHSPPFSFRLLPSGLGPSVLEYFIFIFFPLSIFSCIYLFIWLYQLLVAVFDPQGSNPGPLHWECRVLATGLPGMSRLELFRFSFLPKGIINPRGTLATSGH